MKVYALTNVWEYLDTRAEGTCYGVYTTAEKAKKAMEDAVEEAKEQWVECNRVEDVDDIEIDESEWSCTLATDEDIETFQIEIIEVDDVSNG